MNGKLTQQVVEAIASSNNRTEAMKDLGVYPAAFYREARRLNIQWKTSKSSYVLDAHDDLLISRLREAGFSLRAIGEKFEVCHTTISKRLKRREEGKAPRGGRL